MGALKGLFGLIDRWQRRNRAAGSAYGVVKKFSDDNANLLVVSLGWYGFTAIFPLLLVVVTIFGFVGEKSLGTGIVKTLHQFPVVGPNFNPAGSSRLHGSPLGLAIGLVGLIYGAQGVTQTAQQAMASVWNIPQFERTGFLPRLGRSLGGLLTIGGAFVINAFASGYATGAHESYAIRVPVIAALLVLNVGLYFASFRVLTAKVIETRPLLPGSVLGGIIFTLLITLGTGLLTHELKNASNTYGTFGSVIGVVVFLLLLAKLSVYAAELNPVLHRRLYPRAFPFGEPTDADRRVLADLAHQEQRRKDEHIGVGFDPGAQEEAAADVADDGAGGYRPWQEGGAERGAGAELERGPQPGDAAEPEVATESGALAESGALRQAGGVPARRAGGGGRAGQPVSGGRQVGGARQRVRGGREASGSGQGPVGQEPAGGRREPAQGGQEALGAGQAPGGEAPGGEAPGGGQRERSQVRLRGRSRS